MEELIQLLKDTFSDRLKQVILSNSKNKEKILKVKIRPILLKDKLVFQESAYIGTKVFHENYTAENMTKKTTEYMETVFKQAEVETVDFKAVVLVSKKGKITVKKQLIKGLNAPLFKRSLKDLEFFGFYKGCGDRHHTRKFYHYAT